MSKICPKCNKEWPDEFVTCPMDQTPLVVNPQQPTGFSLNLGDANAISGGVNMSDNHSVSHNTVNTTTSNVDSHNVITNNITQIERTKSAEEVRHEKELAFREACQEVYRSGIMTSEQKRKLEDLQYRLGIDENTASNILSNVSKQLERKSASLSPVHQITFNNIKTAIKTNRIDLVNRLIAQLKAMSQRYSVEEIQFYYYMLQAILHPEECIEEYEQHREDKYWQTFWSSIAYRQIGSVEHSELLVLDVGDKWIDAIPQENVFILATINAIIDNDVESAKSLYDNIIGEHSPYLSSIATCLYSILYYDALSNDELKQMQEESIFYSNNLFDEVHTQIADKKRLEQLEVNQLAEERRIQEEAEAKQLAEEKLKQETEAMRLAAEKRMQEEAESKRLAEEKLKQETEENYKENENSQEFDDKIIQSFSTEFGYLRNLTSSEIAMLKPILLSAPKENYQAQFFLGQLYIQECDSATNMKLAYDAIKSASEHGIYEASAFLAYFFLYGKVIKEDLEEAENRIKIDDDYKKNPIFVKMLVDLYYKKSNTMLADIWKTKLAKFKE